MKIVIEYNQTKREINGPFNICIGRADLANLVYRLQAKLDNDHHYGWIEVTEAAQPHIANTPPLPWDVESPTVQAVPEDWHTRHHENCGRRFRGCDETYCPKAVYERTGVWIAD